LRPLEAENGMGDWDRKANWNRDVLERIVALLFALANLADLAAGAPYLRRRQVLEILSHGEAEAWAFVMGLPPGAAVPADEPESACDAARLAASFRALALVLCTTLVRAKLSASPGSAGPRARRLSYISGPAVRRLDAPPPPAPDTS
jgi:hypothetical protein